MPSHLEEHNVSYSKHFKRSIYFAFQSCKASVIFVIHAFCPNVFTETGSNIIKDLSEQF